MIVNHYDLLFQNKNPLLEAGLKIISVEDYFLMNFCVEVPLSVVILIR